MRSGAFLHIVDIGQDGQQFENDRGVPFDRVLLSHFPVWVWWDCRLCLAVDSTVTSDPLIPIPGHTAGHGARKSGQPAETQKKKTRKKVPITWQLFIMVMTTHAICALFLYCRPKESGTSPAIYLCSVCCWPFSRPPFLRSSPSAQHKCTTKNARATRTIRRVSFCICEQYALFGPHGVLCIEAGFVFNCLSVSMDDGQKNTRNFNNNIWMICPFMLLRSPHVRFLLDDYIIQLCCSANG